MKQVWFCKFENISILENIINSRAICFESIIQSLFTNVICNLKNNTFLKYEFISSIGGFLKISNSLNVRLENVTIFSSFGSKTTIGIIILDKIEILSYLKQTTGFSDDMNVK